MTGTAPLAPSRRRVRLSPERRRAQILEVATRLISDSGYTAVTLAAVAEACDIRRPSVLHYFASMDDLLIAVINAHDEDQYTYFQEAAKRYNSGTSVDVRALYTAVFERNISKPELVRLHVMLSVEALSPTHPAHELYSNRERGARSELERRLTWKRDPAIAAAEFTAFWDGLEAVWVRDRTLDIIGVFDSYCERFFAVD
ncbi:TetR/AcrR family transcriptional regulator [Microbacterium sp. LWH7-1.2]|uniref:TetR/AcrR family transcriptional regulator n=1 Tax=Microbacterium sp. LWH7-1.2 TaxID=3135257 RepID=UPI0031398369